MKIDLAKEIQDTEAEDKPEIFDYTLKMKVPWTLKYEQNEIVDALVKNDYFFNCAQTGLGKTITTITAAVHKSLQIKQATGEEVHYVLVVPAAAVKAFVDVFVKVLDIPYNIYTATNTNAMEGARFHIFNYTTIGKGIFDKKRKSGKPITFDELRKANPYLSKLAELYVKHGHLRLIADEAHALQNPNTIQYRVVQGLSSLFKGMWFLTATPILNDLDGFYHMVDLLKPGFFKNIYSFKNTFQILETNTIFVYDKRLKRRKQVRTTDVVGYKNLDLLAKRFEEISIIRSNQYNINFNYRSTKLSDYMLKYYKLAVEGLFSGKADEQSKQQVKGTTKKPKTTKKSQDHAGARLHDMQRVVSNSHKDFQALDRDEITEKEYLLVKTIKEVLDREEAVLIYFSYLESLDRVKYILNKIKDKFNIPTIHEISGSVKLSERKAVEAGIKKRDVVLITSAGTESVNLQKANNLIFYEIPFALRQFIQACGRIARTDSKFNEFDIYILEAEGTIDTYKKNRILMNAGPIKSVLGGSNILPTDTLELALQDKKAMKDELLWMK